MKNLQITTDFNYSQDNYCYQENIKHLRKDTYIYADWGNVAEIGGTISISFEYEVKRETFGDSIIINFDEEFEYGEWGNNCYNFDLDIDRIINCIFSKTHFQLSETETKILRKHLESLDQSDVKYNY